VRYATFIAPWNPSKVAIWSWVYGLASSLVAPAPASCEGPAFVAFCIATPRPFPTSEAMMPDMFCTTAILPWIPTVVLVLVRSGRRPSDASSLSVIHRRMRGSFERRGSVRTARKGLRLDGSPPPSLRWDATRSQVFTRFQSLPLSSVVASLAKCRSTDAIISWGMTGPLNS
jgi:hypothetical protein